jgi:hypothetical protein
MSLAIRRRSVLLAAVVLALPRAAAAQTESEAVSFVRDLYTREIARHAAHGRTGEAEFLAPFASRTQAVWRASRVAGAPASDPAGPILNAYFGWGVLPGHAVTLDGVASGSGLSVSVRLTVRGEARTAVVQLVRENRGLRVADIAYGRGESFLAYHRRRAGM